MNNYHIYEEQAKGKYSVIFKARKKKKLEFVAIKRLEKTRKAKVDNEARILSELNHQNIIKFYDISESRNHMWVITEYCPGADLLKIIEYDKQMPQHTVRTFMLEILAGLHYAHSRGVIVCDIKPACILLNEYGSLKLGDFGSAQKLIDLMGKAKTKKKGTPSYMAPELFDVNGVYSFQSDLWAVGCIMYELGQGNPPFVSTNFQEIADLAMNAPTPKIDHFSSDFNNLLSCLLEKDPVKRIQWPQLIAHPWIGRAIRELQIPQQTHFAEYIEIRSKKKSQKMRLSMNIDKSNYVSTGENITANNRREVFQFENNQGGYEEEYENEEFDEEKVEEDMLGSVAEVNMKKNKGNDKKIHFGKSKPIEQKKGEKQIEKKETHKIFEDSATFNMFMQTMTAKPTISLQEAIQHQSDTAVKPIIGNKDIEVIESTNFNKNQLGFSYIEPQILAQGIVNHEMDDELKRILDGMKGDEKINVLGYFETIVQNSEVANELFKSNYIPYYMSLLKSYKQSSLRAKICEVLGLLIRHATSIDSDILKYGIINGFVEAITKDKSEKVRRKAMAALGQLLFYGATQVDQDAMEWDVSMNLISSLLKILKNPNEDEIVKIYCCKSIENITAQAQKVGLNFSQIDTLMVMVHCFTITKNQGFKTSIICTIHHMITLNQTLRELFLQKMCPNDLTSLVQTLQDPESSSKAIQIIIWILLMQFTKSPKSKITKYIIQSKNLMRAIIGQIENGSSVVKGRVYLYIYFLLTNDFKKVQILAESKLFHSIERYSKDTGKYESQSLQFVVSILYENFHLLLRLANEELQTVLTHPSITVEKNNYLVVISQMQSCTVFEELFSSQENVQFLLNLMNIIDIKQSVEKPYLQHLKNHYFLIMEKIFTNSPTTEKLQEFYCATVLPFLIGKLLKTPNHDIKFSCVKYIIYIISFCLSDQFLYDSTILHTTSSKITALVMSHLIPQFDVLFDEHEVVANMVFKLMAELFKENRSRFVTRLWEVCDLKKVLRYFSETSSGNVLKSVELIFGTNISDQKQRRQGDVANLFWKKTIELLKFYSQSNQQLFLEYPLGILANILQNHKYVKPQKSQIDSIFEFGVILQSNEDQLVRTKAQNLIEILLLNKLFSEKGLQDWKALSKKGMENYKLFQTLSGLKANVKPTEMGQQKSISRYNQ